MLACSLIRLVWCSLVDLAYVAAAAVFFVARLRYLTWSTQTALGAARSASNRTEDN